MSAPEDTEELVDDVMERCRDELDQRGFEDATVTRFTYEDLPVVRAEIVRDGKRYGFDITIKVTDVAMDVYDHQVDRFTDQLEYAIPE